MTDYRQEQQNMENFSKENKRYYPDTKSLVAANELISMD